MRRRSTTCPGHSFLGLEDEEVRDIDTRTLVAADELRHALHGNGCKASETVQLLTGLTCTADRARPGEPYVDHLECRTLEGKQIRVRGREYVVACGGLESTRLLLASRGPAGKALGDHSGHLGRWYMAHVEGVIANVRILGRRPRRRSTATSATLTASTYAAVSRSREISSSSKSCRISLPGLQTPIWPTLAIGTAPFRLLTSHSPLHSGRCSRPKHNVAHSPARPSRRALWRRREEPSPAARNEHGRDGRSTARFVSPSG